MASSVKFAYIKKSSIMPKITSGVIDSYDYIFTKDEKTLYFVDENLNAIPVQSRVKTFDTVADAIAILNSSSDTYAGQYIAIKNGDEYVGYIVNKDSSGDFIVSAMSGGTGGGVKQYATYLSFPSIGNGEFVYYAKDSHIAYAWDETELKYYQIGGAIGKVKADQIDVDIISGGDATS